MVLLFPIQVYAGSWVSCCILAMYNMEEDIFYYTTLL